MAKIVDPDSLNQATEVVIAPGAKTVQLLVAGNLDDSSPGKNSGVTHQALYSFLKEEWLVDTDLVKMKFPIKPVYEAKFDWINGWAPADQQTRDLIRDAGWRENSTDQYACMITLGNMDVSTDDQAYYQQAFGYGTDITVGVFDKTGEVNEAIKIYDSDADNTGFLKLFLRENGTTFDQYDLLTEQGLSALTYAAYRLPLSNSTDIKVTTPDTDIAGAPYDNMTVQYFRHTGTDSFRTFGTDNYASYATDDVVLDGANSRWYRCKIAIATASDAPDSPSSDATNWESYPGEVQIGANYYAYNSITYGDSATLSQIYHWEQLQLRSTDNINNDTDGFGGIAGQLAQPLSYYVGNDLVTYPGHAVQTFDANDLNSIQLYDITVDGGGVDSNGIPLTSTKRVYPFTAAGTMIFSTNLVADTDANYWMYFTTNPSGNYDSTDAIIVNNNGGSPITGAITSSNIAFDFDFDNNVQGGRASTDAPVTIVAMGKAGAEWIDASFTITRTTGLSFPVNAGDENNYSNP